MSLMPVDQALSQLLSSARNHAAQPVDDLPLEQALGHVLAAPVIAAHDVPPWDNSAMDGYALNSADAEQARQQGLPVSQRITAGMAPTPLQPGTCARIFTGAPLPAGADCVEMQENIELADNGLARLTQAVQPGQNVRPQGQDVRSGSTLLPAGLRLRPQDLGVIASVGLARVAVRRPLRVAVVSTGDELVEPGSALLSGKIYNSNRFTLIGALQRLGQQIIDGGILPDDKAQTSARLRALAEQADLIISSGGVSVGEADCLGQVLREQGEVALWKLAIKPGKPFTLGRFADTPLLGLPGNPAATLVTFLLLVRPYLLTRLGCNQVDAVSYQLPAEFDWPRSGSRDEYLRAGLRDGRVVLSGNQSSGVLSSASQGSGLVLITAGSTVAAGESVPFLPFSGLLD
ncbi:molybdopterin molybdotransferase [Halopseudomonas sabulinigri]|uniref:Molybdopterin molybdenumtransferase n=1 Tax=Halopseudomonas sabulinigri TaxID=472181 RepID=A0A1H1PDT7_9GAMM|nr:gephyrin-like molybdotransferase Glp [Halopseudomonas sabulinigri]SDS09402.1 molybdopterin molybdotransferase [Halopseudomonas sabulinigri]